MAELAAIYWKCETCFQEFETGKEAFIHRTNCVYDNPYVHLVEVKMPTGIERVNLEMMRKKVKTINEGREVSWR